MRISVALCTCNGSEYLPEQLGSIGSQTRLPDEVIICDDLSDDDTAEVIRRFAADAPFPVCLTVNSRRLGSTKNFEKAIGLCSGDVIALADQDDVWYPDKLQRIEEAFDADPGLGLVFSDADVVDEHLAGLGHRLVPSTGVGMHDLANLREKPHKVLLKYTVAFGTTMAFRASCRGDVLPVPACWSHDSWIVLVIAAFYGIAFIERPLIMYRQHGSQQAGAPNRRFIGTLLTDAYDTITDPGVHKAGFKSAISDQIVRYAFAYRYLDRSRDRLRHPDLLDSLKEKISHLKAREYAFGLNKVRRSGVVVGELLAGKYRHYSYGLFSAAKDWFLV